MWYMCTMAEMILGKKPWRQLYLIGTQIQILVNNLWPQLLFKEQPPNHGSDWSWWMELKTVLSNNNGSMLGPTDLFFLEIIPYTKNSACCWHVGSSKNFTKLYLHYSSRWLLLIEYRMVPKVNWETAIKRKFFFLSFLFLLEMFGECFGYELRNYVLLSI